MVFVLNCRNVLEALPKGLLYLDASGKAEDTRNGTVLVAPEPVITVYKNPKERVLQSRNRDANPFFHLMEAMWMLEGRSDAGFLTPYVKDFGDRFANDKGDIHGAYGYRWRNAFGVDQLKEIVSKLQKSPQDRQCVLQMWDCFNYYGHKDLDGDHKDRPCNTHAYFRLRDGHLDMTVCCRSNDIIWGAYGANAVHFSFLQEYLAAFIGVQIGTYTQFSNNYHAYVSEIEKLKKRANISWENDYYPWWFILRDDHYKQYPAVTNLVSNPSSFDEELKIMNETIIKLNYMGDGAVQSWGFKNTYLTDTVLPAAKAHRLYKKKKYDEALEEASRIASDDWRPACYQWIFRRVNKSLAKR